MQVRFAMPALKQGEPDSLTGRSHSFLEVKVFQKAFVIRPRQMTSIFRNWPLTHPTADFSGAMRDNSRDVQIEGQQSLAGRSHSPDGAVQGCGLSR